MAYEDPIPALKRQLSAELKPRIDGWRTAEIAVLLRTDQPRISDLRRGVLDRFSLETLIRFASRLRCDVTLAVVPRRFDRRVRRVARE